MTKKMKNSKVKKYNKQDKILIYTFIGLIALVLVLGIVVLNVDKIYKNKKTDITIPILEEKSENQWSVDISNMEKDEEKNYFFSVSNYKDDKILKEGIPYNIEITAEDSVNISVYKNNSTKNLVTYDDMIIENNIFEKDRKTEDLYKVVIKAKTKPQKGEKLTIKINS